MFAHGTWLIDGRLFPPPFFRRLSSPPAVGTSLPPDYPPSPRGG